MVIPGKEDTHYWSEYRRNYELALKAKIEAERAELKQGQQAAAPPSGIQNAAFQKQQFLRGNFLQPQDIWAHDEGGLRRSEDPNRKLVNYNRIYSNTS
jgi:hypothetical protein